MIRYKIKYSRKGIKPTYTYCASETEARAAAIRYGGTYVGKVRLDASRNEIKRK